MNLRIAKLTDQAALDAVFQRSYPPALASAYDADLLKVALPLMTKAQPALLSSGTYYVWEEAGALLGAGGWTIDRSDLKKGHIRHVVTDLSALKQGIARRVIERSLCEARMAGLVRMECWSTRNAEGFYKRMGFERVEQFDVLLDGHVPFPSIRMMCIL